MEFFIIKISLKYEVLSFNESFIKRKSFKVFFHIFDFDFAIKFLENIFKILNVNIFGIFGEKINMTLEFK